VFLLLSLACGEVETDDSPAQDLENTDDSVATDDSGAELKPCEGVEAQVTNLDSADLALMLESKDFRFINVHVPYAGEIPGTDVHISYTDIDTLAADIGELDAKAVLYCKTGPMSATATKALVQAGYCNIYDYPAGMNGWVKDGYELSD
jgi:rhodanese-related sulfurtransferase